MAVPADALRAVFHLLDALQLRLDPLLDVAQRGNCKVAFAPEGLGARRQEQRDRQRRFEPWIGARIVLVPADEHVLSAALQSGKRGRRMRRCHFTHCFNAVSEIRWNLCRT